MYNNFEHFLPLKIAYGVDRAKLLGQDVNDLAGESYVVIVADEGVVKAGIVDVVTDALEIEDLSYTVFSDLKSDPDSTSIDSVVDIIKKKNARCVIGVGGGSAMDVAKTASLVAGGDDTAEAYGLSAKDFPPRIVSTILVPTTSGTGSEVTSTAIFTTREGHKIWAWDMNLLPNLAVLDPKFTVSMPAFITASTGFDAMTHAIESISGKNSNPVVEATGLRAITLITNNLEKAVYEPENLEARGNMQIAAMLAGIAILGGGTTIGHCIGHALGAVGHIHHGRAVSIVLELAYERNAEAAVDKFADIAIAMGIEKGDMTKMELALAGGREFRRLMNVTGINVSVKEDGLTIKDLDVFKEHIFSKENQGMRENNPVYFNDKEMIEFAKRILEQ
jgi:alcohol dehydrogenase class IV